MAYDRTEDEYHLTPYGWKRGTSKVFGRGNEDPRPEGTLETWTRYTEQASGWSKEHVSWGLTWYDESVSEEERRKFRRGFPKPYHDFNT